LVADGPGSANTFAGQRTIDGKTPGGILTQPSTTNNATKTLTAL